MLIEIQVHCGCGQRYDSIQAAMEHAVQHEHAMTIQGKIDPHSKLEVKTNAK